MCLYARVSNVVILLLETKIEANYSYVGTKFITITIILRSTVLVAFPKGRNPSILLFRSMKKKPKATLVVTWIAVPGTTGISRTCYVSLLRALTCCLCVARVASRTDFTEPVKKSEREPAKPLQKKRAFSFSEFFFPRKKVWHDKQARKETEEREESKDRRSDYFFVVHRGLSLLL